MRISKNIKTITLLPIVLVIVLTSYLLFTDYMDFKDIESNKKSVNTINTLKELLRTASNERETAIQILLGNSNERYFKFNKNIKKTNDSINEIVKLYNQNKDDKLIYKIIKDIKK
jgi:hypothetical protein